MTTSDEVLDLLSKPENHTVSMTRTRGLLLTRAVLSEQLSSGPLNPEVVLARAETYRALGYPDLAAADAYVALTLAETAEDSDFSDLVPECKNDSGEIHPWPAEDALHDVLKFKAKSIRLLMECLTEVGCFGDANEYYGQLVELLGEIQGRDWHEDIPFSIESPEEAASTSGWCRREVYPWNVHEPDRTSAENLKHLNQILKTVAPYLEVRAISLPVLTNNNSLSEASSETAPETAPHDRPESSVPSIQLGLFSSTDLLPGTEILRERSLFAAVRSPDASLCDTCTSTLPELSSTHPPVACQGCGSTIFCSEKCLELATSSYHSVVCNNDDGVNDVGRSPNSDTPSDDLYFLLIARTIAVAEQRNMHPLDLPEIRYLWGDFGLGSQVSPTRTLPFSLHHNIILPFTYFTTLMSSRPSVTPYTAHWLRRYDFWVIQTLFAKFRGVASARQSEWDGKPEAAAVHPLWCLANHSCAPNVKWSWGLGVGEENESKRDGDVVFKVRDERVWKRPGDSSEGSPANSEGDSEASDIRASEWRGIKEGSEILNHYCDITLPVHERRAWARGALGGDCICERCSWESAKGA